MADQKSIKESLSIIRKALEDETSEEDIKKNKNILILDKLVKDDGTIKIIDEKNFQNNEVNELLDKSISKHLDNNLEKLLEDKIPQYLDKYNKLKK